MSDLKRDYIIDIIKVFSLLCVIIIHDSFTDSDILHYGFPFYLKGVVPVFILLSAYVLSMSFDKKNIDTYKKAYSIKYLSIRLARFLIPYLFIISLQILFKYIFMNNEFSIRDTIYSLISGGYGPGGYYNVIMIQLVFLFPLIYFLVKKKGIYGLIMCFLMNLLFEIIQSSYLMNGSFYRLISLRYIFVMGAGVFLYTSKKKFKPKVYIISVIIGTLYILLVDYTNYKPLFLTKWSDTSLFFGFYMIPIIYNIMSIKRKDFNLKFIPLISKASYNIFLIQMLLYYVFDSLNYSFTNTRFINILVMIVLSFSLGIIFYKIETPITKKVIKILDNINIKNNGKIEDILLEN